MSAYTNRLMRFLSFMLILTTFLPIVYANLPRYITGFNLWAPIWFLCILSFGITTLRNQSVIFLIIYFGVIILLMFNTVWSDISDWNQKNALVEFYNLAVPVTLIAYFYKTKDYNWLGKISLVSIIFIVITAVFTIRASIIMPGYARMVFATSLEEVKEINQLGGGNYGFAGLIICIIPILIYYFKHSNMIGIAKWIVFSCILLCYLALIQLQFFANILIGTIVFILSMVGRDRVKASLIPVTTIAFIFAFIPLETYSQLFLNLSYYFSSDSDIHRKFQDFSYYIMYGESYAGSTDIQSRADRYPVMFNLFLSNPLFGYSVYNPNNDTMAGEHLYWMNKLATFGLVGFVPFLVFYFRHFSKQAKFVGEQYRFYLLLSAFAVFILGWMKVLAGREMWIGLIFIVPGMYYIPAILKRGDPAEKQMHFEVT